jgi:hypothetical protein
MPMSPLVSMTSNSRLAASRIDVENYLVPATTQHYESPIDLYILETRQLIQLTDPSIVSSHPSLCGLLLLGLLSSTENYLRRIISKLIHFDSICRAQASEQMIRFGTIDWYNQEDIGQAFIEQSSLANKSDFSKKIAAITGFNLLTIPTISDALEEYENICQLRHCLVHSGGILRSYNAQTLGLGKAWYNHAVKPSVTTVNDALKALEHLVREINYYLFTKSIDRKFTASDKKMSPLKFTKKWHQDKSDFIGIFKIFWCTEDIPFPSYLLLYVEYLKILGQLTS